MGCAPSLVCRQAGSGAGGSFPLRDLKTGKDFVMAYGMVGPKKKKKKFTPRLFLVTIHTLL